MWSRAWTVRFRRASAEWDAQPRRNYTPTNLSCGRGHHRCGCLKMPDTRLIERWLPIAQIGVESTQERRSMTALPPTYYLHVWWARRPLVASRAAVLASLLPADTDREKFRPEILCTADT